MSSINAIYFVMRQPIIVILILTVECSNTLNGKTAVDLGLNVNLLVYLWMRLSPALCMTAVGRFAEIAALAKAELVTWAVLSILTILS
jgi:hypothetical protein